MTRDEQDMTVSEVAAELGISKGMVRKLTNSEPPVLRSYRMNPSNPNSARRIPRGDVEKLKKQRAAQLGQMPDAA